MNHELLTPEEVAAMLRVHPETVLRALRSGKLSGTKVGRQWRVARETLEEYLRAKPAVGGGTGA